MSARSPLRAVFDAPEKRAIDRSYVELDGFYVSQAGAQLPCTIFNISPMGAQVVFPGASQAPNRIGLTVPAIGMTYLAEVRWQAGDRIGVKFISAERMPGDE